MMTLRVSHRAGACGVHRVALRLDGPGVASRRAVRSFRFALGPADREALRWYLEEYPRYRRPPTDRAARAAERRLRELGARLFTGLFGAGAAAGLWAALRPALASARVVISSPGPDIGGLPWELLQEPASGVAPALAARSFGHRPPGGPLPIMVAGPPVVPRPVPAAPGPAPARLRVLLVVSRPAGAGDLPLRTVATQLTRLAGAGLHLDLLCPPTFARLAGVLERAARAGQPYDVVHFDGHGAGPAPDRPACLVFEDPALAGNRRLVGGAALGALLVRAGVPVLVVNACRSAHGGGAGPGSFGGARAPAGWGPPGGLAREVAAVGVPGVVAMRYRVFVSTAARFAARLYAALLDGDQLAAAVTLARRYLHARPDRPAPGRWPPRDWCVPLVYEAGPLAPARVPAGIPAGAPARAPGAPAHALAGVPAGIDSRTCPS